MIHPTAIVHPNANIARGVDIGPYCLVGENVSIGKGTVLQAHVVINGWTSLGQDCEIYPFATIGASSQDRKYTGERAFTKIGSRTVLREYVSVQRATGEDAVTAVGDDCLLPRPFGERGFVVALLLRPAHLALLEILAVRATRMHVVHCQRTAVDLPDLGGDRVRK